MAMRNIQMQMTLFRDHAEPERQRSQHAMLYLLEALTEINEGIIETYRDRVTPLYRSQVRWKMSEPTGEEWQDILTTIEKGWGDCEDLACWRVADLRKFEGVAAHPFIRWRKFGDHFKYHCLVVLPDGTIEDPSIAMGMRGTMSRAPVYVGHWDERTGDSTFKTTHETYTRIARKGTGLALSR